MKKYIKKVLIIIYRILNRILPKSRKIAVFSSSNGKSIGGNPRAVFEYAVTDPGNVRLFVWFVTDKLLKARPGVLNELKRAGENKSKVKIVRYGHPAYYLYMARAGLWVFDSRQEPYITKGRSVKYLQTWHGTPLKKLGLDIEGMNMAGEKGDIEAYREAFRRESAQWDYLIAQNDFSAETFKRCFAYNGKILKTGYPRNDELIRSGGEPDNPELSKDDKINGNSGQNGAATAGDRDRFTILYAPTWRDDRYIGGGWYAYSSPLDFEKLEKMLGNRYRVLVKPHYLVRMRKGDIPESVIKSGFVEICDGSEEINALYLKADAMITDYSSTMFDYSLLDRPMIFFDYDIKEYADVLRGFYFDFEKEAPGPICLTTEAVAEGVKDSREPAWTELYGGRIKAFRHKYNMYDDGRAAQNVWRAVSTVTRK